MIWEENKILIFLNVDMISSVSSNNFFVLMLQDWNCEQEQIFINVSSSSTELMS